MTSASDDVTARCAPVRLDLGEIESALRELQREFPRVNRALRSTRDPLDDRVLENLLEGYALVNRLVARSVDVFRFGGLQHLLELNAIVLCGVDPGRRVESQRHLAATEAQFYDSPGGGIRNVVEWLEMHAGDSVWRRAAGVYVRVLSQPQLFVEGNHRTGALMMSYLLARSGQPPFVLLPECARAYFDPSSVLRDAQQGPLTSLFRLPRIKKRFATFLKDHSHERFLRR